MDASQADYRRIGLSVAAALILIAVVVAGGFISRSKTPFEREQARAEAMNPGSVLVEITTDDNRREYRESEPIFVMAHFSSTMPYQYKIETAEGRSGSIAFDLLHLSDGRQRFLNQMGFECCDSHLAGLYEEPYTPPRTRTPLHLAPGKYEIYLTSRRVFRWDAAPKEYQPSSFQVASNLLKIRVVPDAGKAPGGPNSSTR
jgi:hypothetical protein